MGRDLNICMDSSRLPFCLQNDIWMLIQNLAFGFLFSGTGLLRKQNNNQKKLNMIKTPKCKRKEY